MLKNNVCFNQILVNNERVSEILNNILSLVGLDVSMLDSFINTRLDMDNSSPNTQTYSGNMIIGDNVIINYYHDYARVDSLIFDLDMFKQKVSFIELISTNSSIIIEGYKDQILVTVNDKENKSNHYYEFSLDAKKNQINLVEKINISKTINFNKDDEKRKVYSYKNNN